MPHKRDAGDVLSAVHARAAALADGDADVLRHLLHPRFRWTSHQGAVVDRDAYIANNTGTQLVWTRQTLDDVVVVVVERTAVVTAVATDEVRRAGHGQVFRMPLTQTWVYADGRWQCLSGHAGPLIE